MSAEALGRILLGEVKEENLADLLSSVRTVLDSNSSSQWNVPAIYQLLSIFHRTSSIPLYDAPAPWSSPQYPSRRSAPPKKSAPRSAVVEISGRSSCSGKTQFLYYITALSVLPATCNGHSLNGKEGVVVVLDIDGRFDVLRLRQVMRQYIQQQPDFGHQSVNRYSDVELDVLLTAALHHVHIFRPQSSASLLATVESLPYHLLSSTAHISQNRCLQALLLDSASAFFWQDRMADDHFKALADGKDEQEPGRTTFVQTWQSLVHALRSVQSTFQCTIISTNWGLFNTAPSRQQQQYTSQLIIPSIRPHLPPVWTSFCTLCIVVQRDKVKQFAPEIGLSEAATENDQRLVAERQAGFSGSIYEWDGEGWSTEIRERLRMVMRQGSFWFSIREEGVWFDE